MRSTFSYRSAILIVLLSILTYGYALDSRFAPKNGDEYPYMHIVRMTADSGKWLPLQSEMDGIKNTKPPLLFWQGITTTQWGEDWRLAALRWPSLLYTGLTAFCLFLAVRRFSGKTQTGLLAALVWLSFFATYRYGRPFLTDPPEVFYLSLPFMILLFWGRVAFESKFFFPLAAAICFGLALLAKSFAYIVPAGFALSLYYWRWREWSMSQFLLRDAFKVGMIAVLALGIFGLWFVLDPAPEAVWKEFVLGENAGKFEARSSNYLLDLLRGGDSIWMLLLTTLANAGLFIFVLITALWQCWRGRRFLSAEESLLLLLIGAFFLVFSLPSQRSGRYLLPVMPAFAALIAIYWERLPLWGFRVALLLQLLIISVLAWVGINLQMTTMADGMAWTYSAWHWALMAGTSVVILIGLGRKVSTKTMALAACFLCYCALNSSLSPLEGSLGRFGVATIGAVKGHDVWVPCDYRAKDEEYRLLIPGVRLHGYPAREANNAASLLAAYPLVAVHSPLGLKPQVCESCKIVGQRMEMRARHTNEEIWAMLKGEFAQYLFVNEYLVATPVSMGDVLICLSMKRAIAFCFLLLCAVLGFIHLDGRPVWAPFNLAATSVQAGVDAPSHTEKSATHTSRVPEPELNWLPDTGVASVHAASLISLKDGEVRAFWFAGSREGAPDVVINSALYDPKTSSWESPTVVIDRVSSEKGLARYIAKLGNPVPSRAADGSLQLFFVTVSLGGWAGSSISVISSNDEGKTWSAPKRLITSPLINLSTLVKSPAIHFVDGRLGLPAYHEWIGRFGEFLRIDGARVIDKRRMSDGRGAIQPVLFLDTPEQATAYFRQTRASSQLKQIPVSSTLDAGQSWQIAKDLKIPNPNAAIAALSLSNGMRLMVLNNIEAGRHRLVMVMSNNAKVNESSESSTWQVVRVLEDDEVLPNENRREFSYPYLVTSDGEDAHLVYTWDRKKIRHIHFAAPWLKQAYDQIQNQSDENRPKDSQ